MEEKKKIHKGFKIYLLIFVTLMLIFMKEENQQRFVDFVDNITKKEIELKKEKVYSGKNMTFFDGSLVKWEENTLTFLKEDGDDKWIKEFTFDDPVVMYGKNIIYVIDKLTGDIYQLNNNGDTKTRIQLENSIFNLKESSQNLIAHSKNEENESLTFMDNEGNKLGNLTVDESILTYSFNNDSTKYVYSSINMKESTISSNLKVNSIDGIEEYKINIPNEIIISTEFINNQVIVLSDSSLRLMDKGEFKWSRDFPLIKDIYLNGNEIYLLYGNNLEVIDLKGETKNKISLGLDYNRIVSIENYFVLYGNKDLLILQNGKEILKYIGEGSIINVSGNRESLALHYENSIEILNMITK